MQPIRGRGEDFAGNLSMSRWAEDLAISGFEETPLIAVHFGPSSASNMEIINMDTDIKEPDLLVFRQDSLTSEEFDLLNAMNDATESGENNQLMTCDRNEFDDGGDYSWVIDKAIAAIEIEYSASNSLAFRERECQPKMWRVANLNKRQGPKNIPKAPAAPNVWVKGEDLNRLQAWEEKYEIPIIVLHFFNHEAFAVRLSFVRQHLQEISRLARKSRKRANRYMQENGIYATTHEYIHYLAEGASQVKEVVLVAPFASVTAGDVSTPIVHKVCCIRNEILK